MKEGKTQPTAHADSLVTILTTGDPAILAYAKSLLAEAEIGFHEKGEMLQDLFGAGRIGTGYNLISGPIELQVELQNEKRARKILSEILEKKD